MTDTQRNGSTLTSLFWGRTATLTPRIRIAALLFTVTTIVSLSFCQLGFWPMGEVAGRSVYIMALLVPPIMGALMFGPATGVLLGLLAGAAAFIHANYLPLDFYEFNFMTPLNTFGLLAIVGLLAGVFFKVGLRRNPQGGVRVAIVVGLSILLSVIASGLVLINMMIQLGGPEHLAEIQEYLLLTPVGMLAQMAVDAVLIALVCVVVDAIFVSLTTRSSSERKLITVFRSWMLLISAIVFMSTSAIIFSNVTLQELQSSENVMMDTVAYLAGQLDENPTANRASVLRGYTVEDNGNVVVTDKLGIILGTDNPERFPVGDSFVDDIGYGKKFSNPEDPANNLLQIVVDGQEVSEIQTYTADGAWTMEYSYISAAPYDGGYVAMVRTSREVFQARFNTLASTSFLAFLLIFATAFVASRLVKTDVIKLIDRTNESLEIITNGNLDERVPVKDSSEFTSLSAGINTTVEALKGTIEEVEQKNAQELRTAKAIQESALPSADPPFPNITSFDLYATMDPAREVGGDFYDFFELDKGRIGFVVADVSGKGIPAALFMMSSMAEIRGAMEAQEDLAQAITVANNSLCDGNDAEMFVTVFAGTLEYETGMLTFVNAGHNKPLIMQNGEWRWLKERSGPYMGSFEGIEYKEFTLQLEQGDQLFAYTDGVSEAFNAQKEQYGNDRLQAFLAEQSHLQLRPLLHAFREELREWSQGTEQSDDITMLALKYETQRA